MKNVMLKISRLKIIVLLASVCLACAITMAGNAGVPEEPNKPEEPAIVEQPEKVEQPAPVVRPEAVGPSVEAEPPLPPEKAEQPEGTSPLQNRLQKEISIEFRNTPIDDALMLMADQADVDIVKSPAVTGNVTVKLTNVPLEEALDNILAAHGYGFVVGKNLIRVAPIAEITDVVEKIVTKTYRITYADVAEVAKALERFKSPQGTLTYVKGTSNIIVTDIESKIKAIDDFLVEIDRVVPQILVEARIYDVTSTDTFDLGIDWHMGRNTPLTEVETIETSSRTDSTQSGDDYWDESYKWTDPTKTPGIDPPDEVESVHYLKDATTGYEITDSKETIKDTSQSWFKDADGEYLPYRKSKPFMAGSFEPEVGGTLRFGLLNDVVDMELVMSILHAQVGAKLLANPRILVLDNETATFKAIREIPYQQLSQTTGGGNIGTTEFKEVGIELMVTPHLTKDRMIRLHIQPQFGVKVDDVVLTTEIFGGTRTSPQPVVDKREANTRLLVMDGQTIVLGGMRKSEVTQDIRKVPVLGDLPFLKQIFSSETEETVTSELVVFITPWIIEQGQLPEAPVLSNLTEIEKEQFGATNFRRPSIIHTRAEKSDK